MMNFKYPVESLAIRRDVGMGDLLMLTPTLRAIQEQGLAEFIDVYCAEPLRPLFKRNSRVRCVGSSRNWRRLTQPYSATVDLNGVVERHPNATTRDRVSLFAEALGVQLETTHTEYTVSRGELLQASEFLRGLPGPVIALAPTASDPRRSWDPNQVMRFITMATERGYSVVPIHHLDLGWYKDSPRCRPLLGRDVRLVAAVLCRVNCVVSVDTGIYHLSVAASGRIGPPLVLPFGATDAAVVTAPYNGIVPMYHVVPNGECMFFPCASTGGGDCQAPTRYSCHLHRAEDVLEAVMTALRRST